MQKYSRREAGLLGLAFGGMLVGASAGCKSKGSSPALAISEKHACKALNDCKGQGGCGTSKNDCAGHNSCKGQGGCATVEAHSCKGNNDCKSQGGCGSGDNGCAGKNSCKAKGGCAVPVKH